MNDNWKKVLTVWFCWVGVAPAVLGQSLDDLFDGRLDPLQADNGLGFQLEQPLSHAEEIPEPLPPGVMASLTVTHEFVDRDGIVWKNVRGKKINTGKRAVLGYYNTGVAFWRYDGRRVEADPKYNRKPKNEQQQRRAEEAKQKKERVRRQNQPAQERILRLSQEELLAEVSRASTAQLQKSADNLPLIIRELTNYELDHTGYSRLLWATRQELSRRTQQAEDYKHVVVLRNQTNRPITYEIRFATHESFRPHTLPPGEWRGHWSALPEVVPAVRYSNDRDNPDQQVVRSVKTNRVYSPGEPDYRRGVPYWLADARNQRFLTLSDSPPVAIAVDDEEDQGDLADSPAPRRLGVQIQSVDVGNGELGLRVLGVEEGSAAARGGLEVGDTITRVDGVRVRDPQQLGAALSQAAETATLRVLNVRNGQYVELRVTFE